MNTTTSLTEYVREITALDASLTDGVRVAESGGRCVCDYGTPRGHDIEEAYYAEMSANDYVVRAHYEAACRKADRRA